jgi:periplasmic divalent cation tolerance protein
MRVILCNCPPAAAPELARALVEQKLAACVNLLPGVRSIYAWEGQVCDEPETTLIIKAPASALSALRETLRRLHPYDVPEIVALAVDVAASHAPYVDWVRATATGPTEAP